ncbi:lysophospholipase L1-like esterase [Arthrobacter sp. CAN_A214]|uniref:SGNH/GDSL hydrolase family protein n=1 Tax=Arthrobacter sp. CAN_A214 TaxID=2787720 RepID=UPI0018CAB88B
MRKHSSPARRRAGALTLLSALVFTSAGVSPAAAHSPGPIDYVALGDSYASGFGAGSYGNSGAGPEYGVQCGQSPFGLPGLLDAQKKVELVGNRTCAGALASTLAGGAVDVPEQVAALEATRVLSKRTDLVTVSAGGNDVGFGDVATACFVSEAACAQAIDSSQKVLLPALADKLEALYEQIEDAAPKATVVVTGYPHLFSPGAAVPLPISLRSQKLFNDATDAVNAAIKDSAEDEGFIYVNTVGKFEGRGVGTVDSWINFGVPNEPGNLHPNAKGYELGYLAAVQERVDLTRPGRIGKD